MTYEEAVKAKHRVISMLHQLDKLPPIDNKYMNDRRRSLINDCLKLAYYYRGYIDCLKGEIDKNICKELFGGV